MALLLAKKLTNAVNAAAEQAGITLECDLKNFYNDGERRAAGCKGDIIHPTTKARVILIASESRPGEVCVEFNYDEVHCVPNHAAVQKIISLLTPPAISHENLSASRITNLPNLSENPLLASYLCDDATCTESWTCGRAKLKLAIASQGFSPDDFTHYPPSYDDKAYEVANVLWNHLAQSCTEPHMVAHHLLAYHDVCPSETVKGRLAYYQDDKKRKAGIRTPIKARKYLQKFFGEFRSPEDLEQIARLLDRMMQGTDEYDVRIYDDSQIDGWADAYYHIASCMSTRTKAYGVGVRETYLCYMTKHYGLDDNDVRLTVLYQHGKPVARTLTYTTDGGKFYVRNYGDDRLVKWLDANGYECAGTLPLGTLLYTWLYDGQYRDDDYAFDLVHPYLDGENDRADLIAKNGKLAFVVADEGHELSCASGSLGVEQLPQCCTHCGAFADTKLYPKYIDRPLTYRVQLCATCESNNVVTIDAGTPHEKTIYSKYVGRGNLVFTHNGELFTRVGLSHLGLVAIEGKVVPEPETVKCCVSGVTYLKDSLYDFVVD